MAGQSARTSCGTIARTSHSVRNVLGGFRGNQFVRMYAPFILCTSSNGHTPLFPCCAHPLLANVISVDYEEKPVRPTILSWRSNDSFVTLSILQGAFAPPPVSLQQLSNMRIETVLLSATTSLHRRRRPPIYGRTQSSLICDFTLHRPFSQ